MSETNSETAAESAQTEASEAPESSVTSIFRGVVEPTSTISMKQPNRSKASAAAPSVPPVSNVEIPKKGTTNSNKATEKGRDRELAQATAGDGRPAPNASATAVIPMLTQKMRIPENVAAVDSSVSPNVQAPVTETLQKSSATKESIDSTSGAGATATYSARTHSLSDAKVERDLRSEVQQPFLDGEIALTQAISIGGGAKKSVESAAKPAPSAGIPALAPQKQKDLREIADASDGTQSLNVTKLLRDLIDPSGKKPAGDRPAYGESNKYTAPPMAASHEVTEDLSATRAISGISMRTETARAPLGDPVPAFAGPEETPATLSGPVAYEPETIVKAGTSAPSRASAFTVPTYLPIMLMVVIVLLAGIVLLLLFRY